MRDEKLVKLEEDLQKVPGIRHVRVVGADRPSEIHIVSNGDRPPKQVVRDVQSLASAGYDIPIDHRIVSVVQLDTEAQWAAEAVDHAAEKEPLPDRPVIDSIAFGRRGDEGWVRVRLGWAQGELTEGIARFNGDRDARAHAAASAVIDALNPKLEAYGSRVTIEDVTLQQTRLRELVVVQCALARRSFTMSVVGSSAISDDIATAAVHATLQGLNRSLSRLAS